MPGSCTACFYIIHAANGLCRCCLAARMTTANPTNHWKQHARQYKETLHTTANGTPFDTALRHKQKQNRHEPHWFRACFVSIYLFNILEISVDRVFSACACFVPNRAYWLTLSLRTTCKIPLCRTKEEVIREARTLCRGHVLPVCSRAISHVTVANYIWTVETTTCNWQEQTFVGTWKSHTNLTHPGKYFRPSKVKIMRPTSPK